MPPQPLDLETVEQIIATVLSQQKLPAPNNFNFGSFFESAPAWLMLMGIMIAGYINLNVRVSTLEYQAQISIQDRTSIHQSLDKNNETIASIKTDLSDIKIELRQALQARGITPQTAPTSETTGTP